MSALGRRPPTDLEHVQKYGLRTIMPQAVATVERVLPLPYDYRPFYNQGEEGACVGFSASWMMSILNRRKYDPRWLYDTAQQIDEWNDTPPAQGTSVRAGMDVLRKTGHRRIFRGKTSLPVQREGIEENRWATTADELRTSIASGVPAVLGIEWFSYFDTPYKRGNDWWIAHGSWGTIRGGHAICLYGASDARQAFKLVNSWGTDYPMVWIPYTSIERLLKGYEFPGEATVVSDRI